MLNDDQIEDGEISDEQIEEIAQPYQPLDRPCLSSVFPKTLKGLDESIDSSDSSSSDDESPRKRFRREEVAAPQQTNTPKEKLNVWSSIILEDKIEGEFRTINVRHKHGIDRSRDIETYDYNLALFDQTDQNSSDESEQDIREKLSELDNKDGGQSFPTCETTTAAKDFEESLLETKNLLNSRKRKMDQRDSSVHKKKNQQPVYRVDNLQVSAESSELEVADDIAKKLHENKMDLILKVVQVLGKEEAIKLFCETQEVENEGGILIANGTRRRTPGGVFFYLLRNSEHIPMEQIRQVFSEEHKAREKFKKILRAKRRQEQAEKLKKSLEDLPPLPTRAELLTREMGHYEDASENNVVDITFEDD